MTFGQLLRQHRINAGLSQNKLARSASIDPAFVNRLEHGIDGRTGKALRPTRETVLSLATALELNDSQTDRFLFTAGHAPTRDYQALWESVEEAVRTLRRLPLPESPNVLTWRAG